MIKDVRVGWGLITKGITANHRAYPTEEKLRIFGGDTESIRGQPHTLQLVHRGHELFEFVNQKNIFPIMMKWLLKFAVRGGVNLVFFHNLNFDFRIIFWDNLDAIYDQYNDINFERDGYVVKMMYGRVNRAQIWEDLGGYLCPRCHVVDEREIREVETERGIRKKVCANHPKKAYGVRRNLGTKIVLMDSAAFCPPGSKSMAAALKIYGVPYKKMDAPKGLGERRLKSKYFIKYSMNDARAEEPLGRAIMDLHKEYDVTTCVSLPQLAARILRHHFFREGEALKYMPEPCRLAAELSYHAGKNGFYVKRGIHEDVYEYDINSAFPKAMKELPQMVKGDYVYVKKYDSRYVGIYRLRGRANVSAYPAIFNHDFRPIREGPFKDVWVTGYEIECLEKTKDYDFQVMDGWIWRPDENYHHSPLADFVDRFWTLKSTAPKGPKRDTYKNILNSLYGKFAACVEKRPIVQTAFGPVPVCDPNDTNKHFIAGALYHPFIATQITGYVRRELFDLERRGSSMHSATDSIKSKKKLKTSDELGGVKLEAFGRCYLFRTKLYLHFSKTNEVCGHDLKNGWIRDGRRSNDRLFGIMEDGQHLCKYALHGFKGNVFELYKKRRSLMENGFLEYKYRHMVSLREGKKRGEPISDMVERKERLVL